MKPKTLTRELKSITLSELSNQIQLYLLSHPESCEKPVFHDGLHLDGNLENKGDFIELY